MVRWSYVATRAVRVGLLAVALVMAPDARARPATLQFDRSASFDRQKLAATSKPKRREDTPTAERHALDEARRLADIPQSYEVVIIDPELAPDPAPIRRLDAFTVRESTGALRPKIFINRESRILREAARGESFYVAVLAAVLVHEVQHLKGESESAARLAERRFFHDLIAKGVVSETDGLRYAAVLKKRLADTDTNR